MAESGVISPSRAQQHDLVKLHSPLAIVGVFLFLLREYFGTESLPWQWTDNDSSTGIIIETAFNPHTETADGKPSIIIDKGQTAYGQVVLGNKDQYQVSVLEKRLEHFYTVLQTDISIQCISPRKAESALIADAVMHFISCSKGEISRLFAIREFSPLVTGGTGAFNKDEKMFTTPINFRVELEARWATIPVAAPLRRIEATFTNLGLSLNDGFVQIYQHSTGRSNV